MHAINESWILFFFEKRQTEEDWESTSKIFEMTTTTCWTFDVFIIIIKTWRNNCFICKWRDVNNLLKALLRSHFQKQIWNIFLKVLINWFARLKCCCLTIEKRWKCRKKSLRFDDVVDDRERVFLIFSYRIKEDDDVNLMRQLFYMKHAIKIKYDEI